MWAHVGTSPEPQPPPQVLLGRKHSIRSKIPVVLEGWSYVRKGDSHLSLDGGGGGGGVESYEPMWLVTKFRGKLREVWEEAKPQYFINKLIHYNPNVLAILYFNPSDACLTYLTSSHSNPVLLYSNILVFNTSALSSISLFHSRVPFYLSLSFCHFPLW